MSSIVKSLESDHIILHLKQELLLQCGRVSPSK
jgi:hypothetical protein